MSEAMVPIQGVAGEGLSDAVLSLIWESANGKPVTMKFGPHVTILALGDCPPAADLETAANTLTKMAETKGMDVCAVLEWKGATIRVVEARSFARKA